MTGFSRILVCMFAGALIAGCSNAGYRSGKGNDHLVQYRASDDERTQTRVVQTREVVPAQRVVEREVVYVEEPQVIYQPAPTYRVVTSRPDYTVVTTRPTYRYVPVTRYYYD